MNCKGHSRILVMIVTCSILISAAALSQERKYQIFTPEDLLYYDGGNGRPAYVEVDVIVCDASKSEYWKGGIHESMHQTGMDLTADLLSAPYPGRYCGRCHGWESFKDRRHGFHNS